MTTECEILLPHRSECFEANTNWKGEYLCQYGKFERKTFLIRGRAVSLRAPDCWAMWGPKGYARALSQHLGQRIYYTKRGGIRSAASDLLSNAHQRYFKHRMDFDRFLRAVSSRAKPTFSSGYTEYILERDLIRAFPKRKKVGQRMRRPTKSN